MIVSRSNCVFASVVLALLLSACGADAPAPPAAPAAPPAAEAPAAEAPAAETTTAPEQEAPAAAEAPESVETAPTETTPTATPAPTTTDAKAETPAPAAPIAPPSGPEPREGVDYTVIDPPAPFAAAPGKIEVAEAFAYYCIHCAHIQERIAPWKKALPADVEFRYVPMAHGQAEQLGRAFYAIEAMGELERTHEKMFQFAAVDRRIKQGTADEIVALYVELGIDEEALRSTMQSFAVNAQIARNQKAVTRWAIEGTPTFVVNGRYKAVVNDRGHDGVISTVEHLIARERARLAGTPGAP